MYDYLIVGAGLYGAVFAHEAKKAGKKVLVIDRRPNIAGNVYTEPMEGIQVHKYGAHIFHTNNKEVWNYVNQFAEFNRFTNSPVANYHGELYSLPFNMYTFNKMWGVVTPQEAAAKIEEQRKAAGITEPKNLEEQAISAGTSERSSIPLWSAKAQAAAVLPQEINQRYRSAYDLSHRSRHRRSGNSPMEHSHEQNISRHIEHTQNDRYNQPQLRLLRRHGKAAKRILQH